MNKQAEGLCFIQLFWNPVSYCLQPMALGHPCIIQPEYEGGKLECRETPFLTSGCRSVITSTDIPFRSANHSPP